MPRLLILPEDCDKLRTVQEFADGDSEFGGLGDFLPTHCVMPAEAATECGFENEPAPALNPGQHGLAQWFQQHPTLTTMTVLALVGLAYWGVAA